ncbi:hypothetical protein Baya_13500 [Bagarius yarrelli]|uniref:Uncharacterized protein n=1 Tax=Bagarius yarrelli TaxID=175774 RepID=A0A556V658_BAGYA|nr:hypothetical protein Baya_13500 [Bagarius yarrelli]
MRLDLRADRRVDVRSQNSEDTGSDHSKRSAIKLSSCVVHPEAGGEGLIERSGGGSDVFTPQCIEPGNDRLTGTTLAGLVYTNSPWLSPGTCGASVQFGLHAQSSNPSTSSLSQVLILSTLHLL